MIMSRDSGNTSPSEAAGAISLATMSDFTHMPDPVIRMMLVQIEYEDLVRALAGLEDGSGKAFTRNLPARGADRLRESVAADDSTDEDRAEARARILASGRRAAERMRDMLAPREDEGQALVDELARHPLAARTVQETIQFFVRLAEMARLDGVLGMEKVARAVDDPDIRRGLELLIEGTPPKVLARTLIDLRQKRDNDHDTRYDIAVTAILCMQAGAPPSELGQSCAAYLHRAGVKDD